MAKRVTNFSSRFLIRATALQRLTTRNCSVATRCISLRSFARRACATTLPCRLRATSYSTARIFSFRSSATRFSRYGVPTVRSYTPFVLVSVNANDSESVPVLCHWVERTLGVPAWNRIIVCNRKDLLLGDYIIDRYPERLGAENFMGTVIHFGEEPFKTWEEVITYFDRLGGQ